MELKEVLEILVKGIVQTEDAVIVKEITDVIHGKETHHFTIQVANSEFSLLVGKGGSTIKALRVVMSKLSGKQKKLAFVDLDESAK